MGKHPKVNYSFEELKNERFGDLWRRVIGHDGLSHDDLSYYEKYLRDAIKLAKEGQITYHVGITKSGIQILSGPNKGRRLMY